MLYRSAINIVYPETSEYIKQKISSVAIGQIEKMGCHALNINNAMAVMRIFKPQYLKQFPTKDSVPYY